MNKLVTIITSAIAFLAGLKQANAKLKEELDRSNGIIAEQALTIEALKQEVANDTIDDAALETKAAEATKAAEDAKARADALQAEFDATNAAGEELAKAINEEPSVPNVDPNFGVIS